MVMATSEVQTAERLARLEAQHEELVRLMREAHTDMQGLRADVSELKTSLTKWKGIGAGIVITVSLLWSGVLGIYHFVGGK
jgi:hypothetical protein